MREYNFPTMLSRLLTRRKMTNSELADLTGVRNSSITFYCQGKNVPNAKTVLDIADALKVSTDYLLTGVGSEKPVKEVKAEWIIRGMEMQCNKCLRKYPLAPDNYCRYCGCKMRTGL